MVQRTFGSVDPSRRKKAAPETFKLQGLYQFDVTAGGKVAHKEDEPWEETFTCLRTAPPGVLDDLMAATAGGPDGVLAWDRLSLIRFIKGVVVPGDEARLEALLRDKARAIDLQEDLGPLVMHLAERLGGFPTTPSSS